MKSQLCFLVVATTFIARVPPVAGHGRLIEPPSRASAWRYGFATPPNYNDHELYCGGFSRQWHKNGGRCGVCGDAWDLPTPRPHEIGGAYGQGVIVRRYAPGAVCNVRVELTANHNGYFEFRVCERHLDATQECFDRNLLRLVRAEGNRFYPRDGNRIYEMKYRLPTISCKHCVLQWIYTAGNNWGTCPNGTGAVGCGPQEEFRACSDIAIGFQPDTNVTDYETTTTSVPFEPPSDQTYPQGVTTILIVSLAFLLVVVVLALLYVHYYQLGKKVKTWLKCKKTVEAPVPPPRARRLRQTSLSASNSQGESLA